MALVNRGTSGWFLTVSLKDQQADPTTMSFELQATDSLSAITARDAIVAALTARSKSVVVSTYMAFIQDEASVVIPTNGADNSIKARIAWQKAGGGVATQDIPAPADDTWVAASGKNNNIVDGSVFGAWAALFASGGSAYISDGEFLTATPFLDGQRVSVKKGKRRN